MVGSRTILFNVLMLIAGSIGFKLAPAIANDWAGIFVTVWAVGGILLRQITKTPIFTKEVAPLLTGTAEVTAEPSITKDDVVDAVGQALGQIKADPSVITTPLQNLTTAVNTLAGHPLFNPELADSLVNVLAAAVNGDPAPGGAVSVTPVAAGTGSLTLTGAGGVTLASIQTGAGTVDLSATGTGAPVTLSAQAADPAQQPAS